MSVTLHRGNSGDGSDLASTLCKYGLRRGDLFVLSWARMQTSKAGKRLQTTQPTSGGDKLMCKLCRTLRPAPQWGPDLPFFFGKADHSDPLGGWRCSSQKRVMSILIQVRQH